MDGLPKRIQDKIVETEAMTSKNTGIRLNLALNYGGREEITHAARTLAREVKEGRLKPEEIDEQQIGKHIYTHDLPDPDIIIRPSGELRLSNFMLWQAAYAEFWFSDINWPDFSRHDVDRMIRDYQKRNRRFGGI